MRYTVLDDFINTKYHMKSICRPAVAQWTRAVANAGRVAGGNASPRIHLPPPPTSKSAKILN